MIGLLLPSFQETPVVVLAHAREPSAEVVRALEEGTFRTPSVSKRLGLIVMKDGPETWVRDAQLLNLEAFEARIRGLGLIAKLADPVAGLLDFKGLSQEERLDLWEFFRKSAYAANVGPLILRDDLRLRAEPVNWIVVSDGKREVTLSQSSRPTAKAPALPDPTEAELAAFANRTKEESARLDPTDRGERVSFRFFTTAPSLSRIRAMEAFGRALRELLEAQNDRYSKARAQVLAKFGAPAVAEGDRLTAHPSLAASFESTIEQNYRDHGFASADDARAFVRASKIKSVRTDVGLGFESGGVIRLVSIRGTRYGGP